MTNFHGEEVAARKSRPRLTRKLIKRCWTIGSAGDLKGWMDRFIDELANALKVEIPDK